MAGQKTPDPRAGAARRTYTIADGKPEAAARRTGAKRQTWPGDAQETAPREAAFNEPETRKE